MSCLFLSPPDDFSPQVEAAGCYCEYEGTILFLKRAPHKPYGGSWTIPGGKLEAGETPQEAVLREVEEETGINLSNQDVKGITKFYARGSQMDFVFYTFWVQLETPPTLALALEEHVEARWVTVEEALQLPLIYGGAKALLNYRDYKASFEGSKIPSTSRPKTS